jgi:hypothetical protein
MPEHTQTSAPRTGCGNLSTKGRSTCQTPRGDASEIQGATIGPAPAAREGLRRKSLECFDRRPLTIRTARGPTFSTATPKAPPRLRIHRELGDKLPLGGELHIHGDYTGAPSNVCRDKQQHMDAVLPCEES